MKKTAQNIFRDKDGKLRIEDDWFEASLPESIFLDEMSYPQSAYSFLTVYSKEENALKLGYATSNMNSTFSIGPKGKIEIGKFVVLETTNLISNLSITIGDHCMFSWGSFITDSWLDIDSYDRATRRNLLELVALSGIKHLVFEKPKPVTIEENVWVGFDSVILPGVTLGRNAVIGCKTIISKDVPANAVIAGNPAKIIKYLNPENTEQAKINALSRINR